MHTLSSRGSIALAAVLLASGCLPDLDGWEVGRAGPDGSIAPPPPGTRCAPPVTCGGTCALPWLLASVEDLGPEASCGGQVWRWSLTGSDGDFCTCEPLDAGGRLPRLPFAIGFVPPQTVVVAAEDDRVVAIDGGSDRVLWEANSTLQPADVFAIDDNAGNPMVGVSVRNRGGDIRRIDFYDAARGGPAISRGVNGDLPLGLGISSVTQSPFDRRWLRALKPNSHAAFDVDPWMNVAYTEPPHTVSRDGFFLHTIHAMYDGTWHRTVWTGERSDLEERPSGVYRLAVVDDGGDNRVPLRDECDNGPDRLPYETTCEFLDATADPPLNTSSIAICRDAAGERRIVRVHFGTCWPVVQQEQVHADLRISGIAVGAQTFWD